jgi:hypothetical protein
VCLSDSEFALELRSPGHVSGHGLPPRSRGSRDDGYEERRSPGASEIRATETAGSRRPPLPISLALDQAHATPVWCTFRCLKTGVLFGSWCQSTIGPERECFSRNPLVSVDHGRRWSCMGTSAAPAGGATILHLAMSRSTPLCSSRPASPTAQASLRPGGRSLSDRAESSSLAECAASATKEEQRALSAADFCSRLIVS